MLHSINYLQQLKKEINFKKCVTSVICKQLEMLLYVLTWRFLTGGDRIAFHGSKLMKAPSTLRWRNLKTEVSLWKRIKSFPSRLHRRNLKTQQSPVILDLCLRKTRSGKSHDYRDANFFIFKMFSVHTKNEKPSFQIPPVWRAFPKSFVFVTD